MSVLNSLLGISNKSQQQLDAVDHNLNKILSVKDKDLSIEEKELAAEKKHQQRLDRLAKKEKADKPPISLWQKKKENKRGADIMLLGLGALAIGGTVGGMELWKNKDKIKEQVSTWVEKDVFPWLEDSFKGLIKLIGEELKKIPASTNSILEEAGLAGVDETAAANEPGSLDDKIQKKKEQLKNLSWLEKMQGVDKTLNEQIEYLQTGETVSYGAGRNIRDAIGGSLGLKDEYEDIVSGDISPHIGGREGEEKEVLERLYEITKKRRSLVDIYNEATKNNRDQKKITELDERITELEEEGLKLLVDNEELAKALTLSRDKRIERTSHPEFVVPQKKQKGGAIRKVPGNTTGDKHFVWQNPGDIVVNRNAAPLFFQKGGIIDTGYDDYKGRNIRFATPAAAGFEKMAAAAKRDGINLGPAISSSYRTNAQQANMANPLAAAPGTSKHNFGEAFDINWYSEGGKWIRKNAHNYGFKFNNYAPNSTHFDWTGKSGNVQPGAGTGAGTHQHQGEKKPNILDNLFSPLAHLFQFGSEDHGTDANFLGFFGNVGLGIGSLLSTVGQGLMGALTGGPREEVVEPDGLTNPEELKEDPKEQKNVRGAGKYQDLIGTSAEVGIHAHAQGGVANMKSIKQDNTMHDKFLNQLAKKSGRQVIIVKRGPQTVQPPNSGAAPDTIPKGSGINMLEVAQSIHRIKGANS